MTTENQPKASKRYNYTGVVSSVTVRPDRNGVDWVAFQIQRANGKIVKCVAFKDKAAQFVSQFKEGATAKVFGFYNKRSYTAKDGAERTAQSLNLLWSGEPKADDVETVDGAQA